ncbi:MAG: hypothetical protein KGZ82_00210 [Bacteroidales bacterium]|nr:hypothetical protein [Bacteroidales bacterium]
MNRDQIQQIWTLSLMIIAMKQTGFDNQQRCVKNKKAALDQAAFLLSVGR